jgi:hypothetical protein
MTLLSSLNNLHAQNSLPYALLIDSDDVDLAFKDLSVFVSSTFNINLGHYTQNSVVIKPENTGNINIDQIRKLKNLLYQTSTHDNKVAVIYEADSMNINCSNACLKILEEPSKDTYIFLITSLPSKIIATVKSRCHKLKCYYNNQIDYPEYLHLVDGILQNNMLYVLETVDIKNNWPGFTQSCLLLLNKMLKHQAGCDIKLIADNERLIFKKIKSPVSKILSSFEEVNDLIMKANRCDLERKSVTLLILNLIYEHFSN